MIGYNNHPFIIYLKVRMISNFLCSDFLMFSFLEVWYLFTTHSEMDWKLCQYYRYNKHQYGFNRFI